MKYLLPLVAIPALLLTGCGHGRPETVPVSGTVTFDGQPPPAAGVVYFAPVEPAEGFPRRAGQAAFDASGSYEATSFEEGDGLLPGKYRVSVECWQTAPTMEAGGSGVSYVAEGALLENLDISPDDGDIEHDINVPLAK